MLTLRYNEPVFIHMLRARVGCLRQPTLPTITEDMLENTWGEIDYRLDVLRATKGAHVEV